MARRILTAYERVAIWREAEDHGGRAYTAARLASTKIAKDGDCTCWEGYERVPGAEPCASKSCRKKTATKSRLAMPAPLPQGITFRYHDGSDPDSLPRALAGSQYSTKRVLPDGPTVTAHLPDGRSIGNIQWFAEDHPQVQQGVADHGEVAYVWVDEDQRRSNVGTALFDQAQRVEPAVHHSTTQTGLGRQWAQYEEGRSPHAAARLAMPTWYHVTPSHNRDSILQHGLDHTRGEHIHGDTPGNYFWDDPGYAEQYANERYEHESEQYGEDEAYTYVVMPFHHDGPFDIDPENEYNDELAGKSFYTTDPIPASAFHTAARLAMPTYTAAEAFDRGMFSDGPGEGQSVKGRGPWYHVSPHDLPAGTVLTPGGGQSMWDEVPHEQGGNQGAPKTTHGPKISDYVWIDGDREASDFRLDHYRQMSPDGQAHQYEVDTDHEPEDYNGEYAVPQATIKRRVSRRIAMPWRIEHPDYQPADVAHDYDPDVGSVRGGGDSRNYLIGPANNVWWHGSASGDVGGGDRDIGLHVGDYQTAAETLDNILGPNPLHPAGRWIGQHSLSEAYPGHYDEKGNSLKNHLFTHPDGTPMHGSYRPNVFPVAIVGPMANTTDTAVSDGQAHAMMQRQYLQLPKTQKGYYYINAGEGLGQSPETGIVYSVSATVPSASHFEKLDPKKYKHIAEEASNWETYDPPNFSDEEREEQERGVREWRNRHTTARLAALPEGLHIQPEDDDWVAYHRGTPVGALSVDYSTEVPSIDSIRVHPDYRRRGIGTALWEAAGRPAHTPDDMSADGQAWARAVGGDSDYSEEDEGRYASRLAMPAPAPKGLNFKHHTDNSTIPQGHNLPEAPLVTAHIGDDPRPVGYLEWFYDDDYDYGDTPEEDLAGHGEIRHIQVHPDYRRSGIATEMFDWTKKNVIPELHHSDTLTDEGASWRDYEEFRHAVRLAMPDLNKAISDFAQNGYSEEPECGYGDCLSNSLSFMEGLHPSFNPRLHRFFLPTVSAFPNPAREDLQHSESDPGHWETDELVDDGVYAPADHYAPVISHQGRDHVVDWAMSQFDPRAKVPHIEPLDEYSKRFSYDEPITEFDTEWKKEAHLMTAARLAMPLPMPEGITFHYHPTDDTIPDGIYDQEFESPAVEARHNGDHVGYLAWDYDRYPAPTMVDVHPDYRRHGIGTALWDFARQHEPDLQHSENLTDLGEKWVSHEQSRTAARLAMPAEDAYDTRYPREERNPYRVVPGGPWYHGSDHELPDGTELIPGGGESKWKDIYAGGWEERPKWVWFSDDPDEAKAWGEHVYEIEPTDDGPHRWNGQAYDDDYVAQRARVLRRLTPEEFDALPRRGRPNEEMTNAEAIALIDDLLGGGNGTTLRALS